MFRQPQHREQFSATHHMAESLSDSGSSWGERRSNGVLFQRQSGRIFVENDINDVAVIGGDIDHDDRRNNFTNTNNNTSNGFRSTTVDRHDMIRLPQSTHSLLFTEKVLSLPFGFAFVVLCGSFSCLLLALWDNLSGSSPENPLNVPANVSVQVRAAQFLSILIAMVMEEGTFWY